MIRNYSEKARQFLGRFFGRFSRIACVFALCVFFGALTFSVGAFTNVVTIYDEQNTRTFYTAHTEKEAIIADAGIDVSGCEVDFTGIKDRTGELTIYRPKEVQIATDGGVTTVTICRGTVEDVLRSAGITLSETDMVNVPLKAQAAATDGIVITRISERLVEEVEEAGYGTDIKYTPLLKNGQQVVLSAGSTGKTVLTYRETVVNGEVTERELVSTQTVSTPVNKVMLEGSTNTGPISKLAGPAGVTIGADGVPSSYKRLITGARSTAYTSKKGAVTYSGLPAMVGHVGVNKDEIPLGSLLYITSADNSIVYGFAIAADIGYGTVANIVDLDVYLDSVTECKYFGGRKMNIYVL